MFELRAVVLQTEMWSSYMETVFTSVTVLEATILANSMVETQAQALLRKKVMHKEEKAMVHWFNQIIDQALSLDSTVASHNY